MKKETSVFHLIVAEGYNRGAVHAVSSDATVLGRDAACDIHLIDERASRRHARIERSGGHFVLKDLGSRNGTLVNGLTCRERVLAHGDEITIGKSTLLFSLGKDASAEGERSEPEHFVEAASTIIEPLDAGETGGTSLDAADDLLDISRRHILKSRLVGQSAVMKSLCDRILRAAATNSTVLITGESGTGKELVAEAIHRNGSCHASPFTVLNCAALAEQLLESELFGHEKGAFTGALTRRLGRFEMSHGGTLFLDEIGEVSTHTQAKLLRVIETGEFQRVGGSKTIVSSARIIAATNKDLAAAVSNGEFREDLFFRLNVIDISVPPLRERTEDIPALSEHFLDLFTAESGRPEHSLSATALDILAKHPWPGNVRQLKNALERAYFLSSGNTIGVEDLSEEIASAAPPASEEDVVTLEEIERRHIEKALRHTGGNRQGASRLLGIDRKTLYSKIKRYGLGNSE